MAQKFLGHNVMTTWEDIGIWESFFDTYMVGTIIELGTGHGGLSLFFALQAYQRGLEYHTYDNVSSVNVESGLPGLLNMKNNFHNVDIWNSAGEIIHLIETSRKPIVMLFDNGDKPKEWGMFAPHLAPGDFCAVHDWGTEFNSENIGSVAVQPIMTAMCEARPQYRNGWYTMWFKRI